MGWDSGSIPSQFDFFYFPCSKEEIKDLNICQHLHYVIDPMVIIIPKLCEFPTKKLHNPRPLGKGTEVPPVQLSKALVCRTQKIIARVYKTTPIL